MSRDPLEVCIGKKPYTRPQGALRAAELCANARDCKLRVYQCDVCGAYHLTSQSAEAYAQRIEPKPDPDAGKWILPVVPPKKRKRRKKAIK